MALEGKQLESYGKPLLYSQIEIVQPKMRSLLDGLKGRAVGHKIGAATDIDFRYAH